MHSSFVPHANNREQAQLCVAIQRHLASHPLAADTAAGIVSNWLPPHGFENAIEHIDSALDALVEAHVLRRYQLPDGNVLYAPDLGR